MDSDADLKNSSADCACASVGESASAAAIRTRRMLKGGGAATSAYCRVAR